MHSRINEHWDAVKRILRYLKGTLHFGLQLHSRSALTLHAYSDVDWADFPFYSSNSLVWQSLCHLSCANPVFHVHTKHIEIDYHFVQEKVTSKSLLVRFICSNNQLADSLPLVYNFCVPSSLLCLASLAGDISKWCWQQSIQGLIYNNSKW
jgi:hypothetical protein